MDLVSMICPKNGMLITAFVRRNWRNKSIGGSENLHHKRLKSRSL